MLIPMGQTRMPGRMSRRTAESVLRLAILFLFLTFAHAVELTSFRTPYSRVTTNDVYFYSGSSFSSSAVSDSLSSYSDFRVGSSWQWFTETRSDPRGWSLNQGLWLSWHGFHGSWSWEPRTHGFLDVDEEVKVNWQRYLGRSDFLVNLAPSASLHPRAIFDTSLNEASIEGDADVKLGIGYGRFRDAWPLAKAIRLVGILRDCNLLEEEPKEGPLMKLADFIANSWRLFYAHDRSAKFYYDSLQVILLDARVLRQPLPAYALMKLDDELTVGFDTREFGSQLLLGVAGDVYDAFTYMPARGERRSSTENYLAPFDPLQPTAEYRYARPIGLRWVTGADFEYQLTPSADTPTHTLNCNVTGSYQLSNRLLADANLNVSAEGRYAHGTFANPTVNADGQVNGGFHYYLADRLIVSASVGVEHRRWLVGTGQRQPESEVFFGFKIGAGPQWSHEPTPTFEP